MTTSPLTFHRLTDRSRIVTDWKCRRQRYLGYEWGGTGLAAQTTSLELWMGTVLHDALAAFAEDKTVTEIAPWARESIRMSLAPEGSDGETINYAAEQACLTEGLVRGFASHVWPRLVPKGWKIIAIEKEVLKALSARIGFMCKPDLIVEDPEGNWHYIEYKSTSSKRQQWIDSWATAVQLHSGGAAVEETLGKPITSVIVQGLYKGYESYGRQNSPFCYCWVKDAVPPFTAEAVRHEYTPGFRRVPVWERPGGVERHIQGMSEEMLADQFPQVPPIFVKSEVVERFLAQTTYREEEINRAISVMQSLYRLALDEKSGEEAVQKVLDEQFPQAFDQCDPYIGRACQFKRICHGQVDDPLSQGFTRRLPHHTPEEDLWRAKGILVRTPEGLQFTPEYQS